MNKDWIEIELGKLLDYIQPTKYIVKSTNYDDKYKIPVLTPGKSFIKGYTDETEGIYRDLPAIIFDDFTTSSRFVNFPFKVKSSAMKILKPTSDLVNLKYVFYMMQVLNVRSDTHKRYWISIYSKKQIPFPPLLIQRAIVAKIEQLFSKLDNGIQNLQQAKEKLAVFRQAVLKKAFEGELTNNKNIEWVTINDICEKVEYGTSNKSLTEGDIPVLRMGNIQNGRFDWEDLKYTNNQEEVEKYLLKKNDVLFNRTNSPEHVGKTAIFREDRIAIFAGYLIRIDYYKDKISGEYLNYFLNSHTAKKYGNKVKSFGVNQSNINGTKLKTYPFPKTTLEEQYQIVQEIESRFSVCDEMEKSIESSLTKADALRQSILKKAFSGELLTEKEIDMCKQEPDWETAEELLARIEMENNKTKK